MLVTSESKIKELNDLVKFYQDKSEKYEQDISFLEKELDEKDDEIFDLNSQIDILENDIETYEYESGFGQLIYNELIDPLSSFDDVVNLLKSLYPHDHFYTKRELQNLGKI